MSLELIQREAAKLRDSFISEDGCELVEINMGLCSDFAESLERKLAILGVDVVFTGLDYFWAQDGGLDVEAQLRRDQFTHPVGLEWSALEVLGMPHAAPHTWIEFQGHCFDAEMTAGTKNPFDFPCIRHALVELLEQDPLRLADLVKSYEWWQESVDIREQRGVLVDSVIARGSGAPGF